MKQRMPRNAALLFIWNKVIFSSIKIDWQHFKQGQIDYNGGVFPALPILIQRLLK